MANKAIRKGGRIRPVRACLEGRGSIAMPLESRPERGIRIDRGTLWLPAVFGLLLLGSGCGSRGVGSVDIGKDPDVKSIGVPAVTPKSRVPSPARPAAKKTEFLPG
jgi:hypothetical protein